MVEPVREIDLAGEGVRTVLWATGSAPDFGWLQAGTFDAQGRPQHRDGVSDVPGLYFLGLTWLTSRSPAFIWDGWRDAEGLVAHLAARMRPVAASVA